MGLFDSITGALQGLSEHVGADQAGSRQDLAQGDLSGLMDLARGTPLEDVAADGQSVVESATQAEQDVGGARPAIHTRLPRR
ncbi:MAG: hypothetical protein FJW81_10410 [Actinobacteria bacterium]|nr:hypothetical protein [Actinomycetota bacterium]